MKTPSILNGIGIGILLLTFAWSAKRAFHITAEQVDDKQVTIRFAHWQLEGNLRAAFDEIARDYEKLHPGVRIEQVAVPERIFPQWLNTQLVGGTITDLVTVSGGKGGSDEILTRHFFPISDFVDKPNPYNRDTPLEGVPLRDTFTDGLTGTDSYRPNLLEHYGIPLSAFTVRMFYNVTLWRSIFGDVPPPTDYEEFLERCAGIRAFSKKSGRTLLPIAGSKDNAPILINNLFGTVTQRLTLSIDHLHNLTPLLSEISVAYLKGEWTLDDPAIRAAFDISRETGLNFQPGYAQLGRDDASFYFVQGKAVMITTGSWDSSSFRMLADFEIGVFDLPLPSRDNPKYGAYVLGASSEGAATGLNFGIPRHTKNFEQTLDFLLYLGSQPVNAKFSRISGWLPSVVGVPPAKEVAPFKPRSEGYLDGFDLTTLGADTKRILAINNNALVSHNGSVDKLIERIRPRLPGTVRSDLERSQSNSLKNISRQDVIMIGLQREANASAAKLDETLEAQNRREAAHAWANYELARTAEAQNAR